MRRRPLLAASLAGLVVLSACEPRPEPSVPPPPSTPTPAQAAARPVLPSRVKRLLSKMTDAEKVGQLFMVGAEGRYLADDDPAFRKLLSHVTADGVGGVIWFKSQVEAVVSANARLQGAAKVPLFVAADLEAGAGMRFPDLVWGPYAMAVAATGDPSLAERRARNTALEARALGVNQVYAPVADVNVDPGNPVINVRSFGEDPADVGRFTAAVVRGLQDGGVTAFLKHFPGHGDTSTDSHRSLPVLPFGRDRLLAVELAPFRAGLAAGARGVMTAHLSVPALDGTPAPPLPSAPRDDVFTADVGEVERRGTVPASLSAPIVDGLLRREIGFTGLVVTDSMKMGALAAHFSPGEAAVRAILAGNDVVLHSPDTKAALAAVREAVASGRIPRARLDEAVARVLSEKERLGLFSRRSPPPGAVPSTVGTRAHRALEAEIARRSLTLVREEPGVLPLSRGKRLFHLLVVDEPLVPGLDTRVGPELASRLGEVPTVRLVPGSCEADVAEALRLASEADVVLASLFVRPRSGAGRIAAPPAGKAALKGVLSLGNPVVAVAFGSPYLLLEFPAIGTYLAGYGPQEVVQEAAVAALFGEAPVSGRLPVTLPGLHARGSGIRKEASR